MGVRAHDATELVCEDRGPYNWMPAATRYQTLVYTTACTMAVTESTAATPITIGARAGGDAFGWEGPDHATTSASCEAWKLAPTVDTTTMSGSTPETVHSSYDVTPALGTSRASIDPDVVGRYVVEITCGSEVTRWQFALTPGAVWGLGNFNLGNMWMFENDFSSLSLPSSNNDRALHELTIDPDAGDFTLTLSPDTTQLTVEASSSADPTGLDKTGCLNAGLIHLNDVYGYGGMCVQRETVGTANSSSPGAPTYNSVSHWVNCLDGTTSCL